MESNMKNMTMIDFIKKVASDSPVPGGGSVAAVCGSLSAALAEMVANLTIGKKKYIEVETEMLNIKEQALKLREVLADNIQKDSDAYDKVIAAYRLPKETEEEKRYRQKCIQDNLVLSALTPLNVAKISLQIMPLTEAVIERGNSNAVSDGLVACMLARTAVLSALFNVKINLGSITDPSVVEELKAKVADIEGKAIAYEKKILEKSPL